MNLPRIDVLLPVHCARDTLPDALGDALGQVGVEVRVLAVVDVPPGGDDGSAAWLVERARHEPRLEVLQGPGRGVGAALDAGLEAATSPWLAHMEADDRCQPDRLRRLWDALRAPPSRAASGSLVNVPGTRARSTGQLAGQLAGQFAERPAERPVDLAVSATLEAVTCRVAQSGARTPGMARYLAWQNGLLTHEAMARERWIEIPALHQTGLYRTDAVRACGGYTPRGDWPADIDFWFRWFERAAHDGRAARTAKLPRVMYQWRQHSGQSTRGASTHTLAVLREAKAHYLARAVGRRGRTPRPVHLVSIGATLAAWTGALGRAGVEVAACTAWRPADGPSAEVLRSLGEGTLVVAAYGRETARRRLRASLAPRGSAHDGPAPREPDELLFTA